MIFGFYSGKKFYKPEDSFIVSDEVVYIDTKVYAFRRNTITFSDGRVVHHVKRFFKDTGMITDL
jgi:hypothetical protein